MMRFRHTLMSVMIVLLLSLPLHAQNPAVSDLAGNPSSGQTLIITGSNFGSKSTAAPRIWDNFESGTNGQTIEGKSPVVGPNWDIYTSGGSGPQYSNTANRPNSTLCSRHDFTTSSYNCSLEYYENASVAYFTFWWKYDLIGPNYNRNTKPWIIYGTGNGGNTPVAYSGFGNPDYNDGGLRNALQDLPTQPTNNTLWGGTSISNINHRWVRFEVYLIQSSPNVANGTYMMWVQDPYSPSHPVVDLDLNGNGNRMTRTTSDYWRQFHFGSYFAHDTDPYGGGGPIYSNIYIDDLYFDVTQARVEVGDAPTWIGCHQREIQIPSTWSPTSITITANQGGFDSLIGKYLYVVDAAGKVNANGYLITQPIQPASVLGRHVLYNSSAFDGYNYAPNTDDNNALAPDISPLLPGQTATKANYSSYDRGINSIVIDVANLADSSSLSSADFEFLCGNSSSLPSWTVVDAPSIVAVQPGMGVDDSDRITILWPNNAIQNQWLRVKIKANAHTGLPADDVFYFGHALAETGNKSSDAFVNAFDFAAARDHQGPADITSPYDFNRDAVVDSSDLLLTRNHPTNFFNALKLIVAP